MYSYFTKPQASLLQSSSIHQLKTATQTELLYPLCMKNTKNSLRIAFQKFITMKNFQEEGRIK